MPQASFRRVHPSRKAARTWRTTSRLDWSCSARSTRTPRRPAATRREAAKSDPGPARRGSAAVPEFRSLPRDRYGAAPGSRRGRAPVPRLGVRSSTRKTRSTSRRTSCGRPRRSSRRPTPRSRHAYPRHTSGCWRPGPGQPEGILPDGGLPPHWHRRARGSSLQEAQVRGAPAAGLAGTRLRMELDRDPALARRPRVRPPARRRLRPVPLPAAPRRARTFWSRRSVTASVCSCGSRRASPTPTATTRRRGATADLRTGQLVIVSESDLSGLLVRPGGRARQLEREKPAETRPPIVSHPPAAR